MAASRRTKRRRRLAAAIVVFVVVLAGGVALADPPVVDQLLLATDHVTAQGVGPQQFTVTWHDAALVESHFEVQESIDPQAPDEQWNNVGSAAGSPIQTLGTYRSGTFTANIPPADTTIHYFRVRAILDVNGTVLATGPWSSPDPAIAGPLPPKNIVAANAGIGSVKLTWTNQATGDPLWNSTDVYRQLPGGSYQRIASVAPGVTTFTDPAAPPGTPIAYRVFAMRQLLIGAFVETSSSVGQPLTVTINTNPLPKPLAPTNLMAVLSHVDPTQDRVDLTWVDNATDESGYFLEFSPTPTFTSSSTQEVSIPTPDATSYTQFVVPDTVRFYRVRAFRNSDGQVSDPSNTASIGAIPAAPTNLTSTKVTNAEVDLQWKDNSTTEDGFRVEYCVGLCNSNSTWNFLGNAGTNDTQFADNTVTQLITRSYRVFAFNGSGLSGSSNIITVSTPKAPLVPPAGLAAVGLDSRHIKLTWTPPNLGEDGYRIEYSGDPTGPWGVLNTVGAGISTYTDGFSLNPSTQRCYRLRSYKSTDTFSDATNPACAVTTPPQIPGVPSNLQAVALDSTHIKLTWNDNATNEQGFKIERTLDGQTWSLIATVNTVDLTNYTNGSLLPSHSYTYRVRAFNADGDSDPSNVATATTLGPPLPVWLHPGHDNEIAVSACTVDGTAEPGTVTNPNHVLVYITDTKDGSTSFAGSAKVNPDRSWSLPMHLQVAGTYHLAAYLQVGSGPSAIYSGAAKIFNWIVPADSLIC